MRLIRNRIGVVSINKYEYSVPTSFYITHKIFLHLLEGGGQENYSQRSNGGILICWRNAWNLLYTSSEEEEQVRIFRKLFCRNVSSLINTRRVEIPVKNLGINDARLYLLVETKLEEKSALAVLLLSAIILSPAKTVSFCHGHFHLRFRTGGVGLLGPEYGEDPGNERSPAG